MNYLYGDSTPSQLTSNFLEFLRDALDFAVFVVQADEHIKAGKAKSAELTQAAEAELAGLDRFIGAMSAAIDTADKGRAESAAAQSAVRLGELLTSTQRSFAETIRSKLANDIALVDADEAASREGCVHALATLLGPHAPPGGTSTLQIGLTQAGAYDALAAGHADFGLEWAFDLAIPASNLWASLVRIERLLPHVEIRAPLVTGWISKEVKVRPQRLERLVVTELVNAGWTSQIKVRTEPGFETGFDLEVDLDAGHVKMTRVGPSDDAAVGPFEVHAEDQPVLLDLANKLREATAEFERVRLSEATIDGDSFQALATFVPFVERLVAMLAPIVREIAARSLTPTELVLRHALGDDRREEVFVAKSTLREKYAPLPSAQRALFGPLGLDAELPRVVAPPLPSASQRATARAEIGRSQPPPPLSRPPQAPPPPPAAPTPAASAPPAPIHAPALEVVDESEGRNEAFVDAVKKIVLVLKSGQTDEGYRQYADLLKSPSFTGYRPDDQRQALKLLLLAKAPPTRSSAVESAYVVALTRIQSLVDALAEPADYEMLGVAHLQLGDKKAASAAFDTALKLERARNPSSELCSSLARRVSQLN